MVSEYSQLSGVGKSKWAIFIIFLLHSFILSAPKWHSHGKIELNRRFIKPESWHLLIIVYTNNWGFIVPLSFNYKECTRLEKLIHQIDRMVAVYDSFDKYYGEMSVGFCLNTGKRFLLEV